MSSRQGGKLKPLKVKTTFIDTHSLAEPPQAPKKEKKEEDDEDAAFKAKKKADAEALKALQTQAKGP